MENTNRQLVGCAGLDHRIEVIEGFPEVRRRGGTRRVDLVADHKPHDGRVVAVFFRQPFRSVAVELAKVVFALLGDIRVHQLEWDRQADPDVDWVPAIVPQAVEERLVRRVLQGVNLTRRYIRIAELVVSFVLYSEIEQLPEIGYAVEDRLAVMGRRRTRSEARLPLPHAVSADRVHPHRTHRVEVIAAAVTPQRIPAFNRVREKKVIERRVFSGASDLRWFVVYTPDVEL